MSEAFSHCNREAMFAKLQPMVRGLMRRYGSDPELRQELPGEIYVRFCHYWEAFDPARGIPLRPYLIRSLMLSLHTYVRSYKRQERRKVGLLLPELLAFEIDPIGEAETRREEEEIHRRIWQAIALLPPRQRQAVILRYGEESSYEAIAAELDVSVAGIRSNVRHGINRLRSVLREAAEAESEAQP